MSEYKHLKKISVVVLSSKTGNKLNLCVVNYFFYFYCIYTFATLILSKQLLIRNLIQLI